MTKDKQLQNLMEQFQSVVNQTNQLRGVPIHLEGCEPLNFAAIHLIETIGNHERVNMTEISSKLGITKGAVSQMTAKLVRRGLVSRANSPGSEKEVHLALTAEGQKVFEAHRRLHGALYADLSGLLSALSEDDIQRIALFLDRVRVYMEGYAHSML